MIILPAIDLLGGACVRLHQGSYESASRYAEDPAEVARAFARAGARWVHVVDLDAARGAGAEARGGAGRVGQRPGAGAAAANRGAIRRIREALQRAGAGARSGGRGDAYGPPRLEVGGGIRTEQDLAELGEAGADRLILGTVLAREPERVAAWVSERSERTRYPGGSARRQAAGAGGGAGASSGPELWAGIDALEGRVRVSGWLQEGGMEDVELARRARELGLAGVVYTSIARDGTLAGPDIGRTNRVAEACGLPVILSGGIGSEADVERVARERAENVVGLIVGKALYEGRVELAELIRRYD
jgi:phosphoribosylformimino-5-aminoimidazole carboxamide ribotide isomerase